MKILFAHNRYQQLGGEDLAAKVERELVQSHGHTVDLFEADNSEIVGFAAKAKTALGTIYSPSANRGLAARIRSFKPSVVHILNFFPLLSPSIHYACREAGVPVVQKISNFRLICPNALLLRDGRICEDCVGKTIPWPGVLHACYRDSRVGSTVLATMLATHRLLGTWDKAVDGYIVRTNFSRSKLIEGGLPAAKIAIIPSFAPDPGVRVVGSGRFAFFAGRLSPEKGIATLLSAWDRFNDPLLCLKVAGDGPLRDEVMRRADGRRVEYLGSLSRRDVQGLMREAALLIFPSDCYENFPLSIVEAFACGVPVIASRIGAMAEIIDDGRTGLHFRAGDAEDLAAKVEWSAGHPEQLSRMRRECRAEYLAKYTPERNYQMLMELYDSVTGSKMSAKAECSPGPI
ncbi:MAG: glycosyltransferase [Candidatus Acidiferrales bacterium]